MVVTWPHIIFAINWVTLKRRSWGSFMLICFWMWHMCWWKALLNPVSPCPLCGSAYKPYVVQVLPSGIHECVIIMIIIWFFWFDSSSCPPHQPPILLTSHPSSSPKSHPPHLTPILLTSLTYSSSLRIFPPVLITCLPSSSPPFHPLHLPPFLHTSLPSLPFPNTLILNPWIFQFWILAIRRPGLHLCATSITN